MTGSASTVYKLETAAQDSYRTLSLRKVEADLQWPAGTIDAIASGGPIPGDTDAAPMTDLSKRFDALDERMAAIEQALRDLLRRGS